MTSCERAWRAVRPFTSSPSPAFADPSPCRSATTNDEPIRLDPLPQEVGLPATQPWDDSSAQDREEAASDEFGRNDSSHPSHAVRPLSPSFSHFLLLLALTSPSRSPGNTDFLSMQLTTMQRLQAEQGQKQSLKSQKGTLQRAHGRSGSTGGVRGPRLAGGGAGGRGALSTIQDQ